MRTIFFHRVESTGDIWHFFIASKDKSVRIDGVYAYSKTAADSIVVALTLAHKVGIIDGQLDILAFVKDSL
jgi:hypothetical protein